MHMPLTEALAWIGELSSPFEKAHALFGVAESLTEQAVKKK